MISEWSREGGEADGGTPRKPAGNRARSEQILALGPGLLLEMPVRRVPRPQPLLHPQQLALAGIEPIVPCCWKIVVRVELEHQHRLAIMRKNGIAVFIRPVGTTSMPALAVEDQHTARLARRLVDVFDLEALGRPGAAA